MPRCVQRGSAALGVGPGRGVLWRQAQQCDVQMRPVGLCRSWSRARTGVSLEVGAVVRRPGALNGALQVLESGEDGCFSGGRRSGATS
eukprot:361066-Chlamydomonas_euryale.AAC.2